MDNAEITRRLNSVFSSAPPSPQRQVQIFFCCLVFVFRSSAFCTQAVYHYILYIYLAIYSCIYLKHRSIASDPWCPHQPTLPADTEQELLSLKRKEGGAGQRQSLLGEGQQGGGGLNGWGRGGYIHMDVSSQPGCDGLSPAAGVMCSYEC